MPSIGIEFCLSFTAGSRLSRTALSLACMHMQKPPLQGVRRRCPPCPQGVKRPRARDCSLRAWLRAQMRVHQASLASRQRALRRCGVAATSGGPARAGRVKGRPAVPVCVAFWPGRGGRGGLWKTALSDGNLAKADLHPGILAAAVDGGRIGRDGLSGGGGRLAGERVSGGPEGRDEEVARGGRGRVQGIGGLHAA